MMKRIGWHGDSQDWSMGSPAISLSVEPNDLVALSVCDGYELIDRIEARTMAELLLHFAETGLLPDGFLPKSISTGTVTQK